MRRNYQKGGIVKWLLTLVVLIILASYFFDFNVQEVVEDEQTQSNLGYIWGKVVLFWDSYLKEPASYLWHDVFIDLLWETLVDQIDSLSSADAIDLLNPIDSGE